MYHHAGGQKGIEGMEKDKMTTKENKIDFQVFCSADYNGRYMLTEPFVRNGWKVACDGRLLVRAKTDEADSEGKRLDVESIFEADWKIIEPLKLIMPSQSEGVVCDVCSGRKVEQIQCVLCNGNGMCVCDCGNEHDCRDCQGTGEVNGSVVCSVCEGTGNGPDNQVVEGLILGGSYIVKMIKHLPNPQIVAIGKEMAKFVFDGGEGLLMRIIQ